MILRTAVTLIALLASTAGANDLLFKGTNMASYTLAASWTNIAGGAGRVPIYGDTATIANSSTAQVLTAGGMNVGATVNVSNDAAIFRSGTAGIYFSGTLNFKDNSALTDSQLALYSNAVFNWDSTGIWNGNGTSAQANFSVALANGNSGGGPTVTMSAGTWNLTGNSYVNSFQLDVGTFTMTGGKIYSEDMFKLGTTGGGSRVNLGGTGEIYCMGVGTNIQILVASILNFEGTNSALYVNTNTVASINALLAQKMGTGNVYVDGSIMTNINQLSFSNINVAGIDYTKVSTAPPTEPVTPSTVFLWNGTNNASWTVAGSWTNAAGGAGRVPIYGDTANLRDSDAASVGSAAAMNVGATVNVSNSATLARSGSAYASFSGILTFSDSSQMINSQLRLCSNAVFNWNSTGTWNGNGVNVQANFYVSTNEGNSAVGPTVTMSAGTWNLTGNSGDSSFQLDVGTFNMTGGKIVCEDRFKIGTGASSGTFNLGGTGEVYANAPTNLLGVYSASILNFQGTNFALYLAGFDNRSALDAFIDSGNIYKDGVQLTTSTNNLQFSNVTVDGTDYTKVSVITTNSYALTVTSGTGDGSYTYEYQVAIAADAPAPGYAFSQWTGDTLYLADSNSANTTVTMPAQAVSVTATYIATEQYTTNAIPVPYSWLGGYGITNDQNAVVLLDLDGDGLTTEQEYIAGTVPTNAASVLKAAQATRNVVTWTPQSNRIYSVYWSTNLVKGFVMQQDNIVHPQGSYTNATPDSRVNHYQIKVRME